MRKINKVIIHSSATFAHMDMGVKEIDQWHRQRGFDCIGYNFVIRRNGIVELGRSIFRTGAHTRGQNTNSLGVCWVGGIGRYRQAEDNRTEEQRESLIHLVRNLRTVFGNHLAFFGHNDFANTECPSFKVDY